MPASLFTGKLAVRDGKLYDGDVLLGPDTALYADASEGIAAKGVIGDRQNPGRIDYIFVANGVVGVESKTVDDLCSSWMAGRLQRQFRTMLETCDHACLLIRGAQSWNDIDQLPELRNDLLKWQMLGGFVIFGPRGSPLACLADVKMTFAGARNVRTAVSRYEKQEVEGSPQEQMLQRMFHGSGLGPKTAGRLMAECKTVRAVLAAPDAVWKSCGATRKLLAARRLLDAEHTVAV